MNYTSIETKWGDIISKAGEKYEDGSPVYSSRELLEEFMPTLKALDDMYEALSEILDITHNHATGISKYVGHQKFGNLVVYSPEQVNKIGNLCRALLAKAEGS